MKSLFNLEPASKHIKSIAISRGSIRIQSEISLQLHSDKNIQFIFVNGRYLDAKVGYICGIFFEYSKI